MCDETVVKAPKLAKPGKIYTLHHNCYHEVGFQLNLNI